MTFDLKKYLGEATEYDKKERLEEKNRLAGLKVLLLLQILMVEL